ncbi:MAG: hypothetical protein KatS3mg112_0539 [Thermogutta sp.]|nr:MAG: hypothetical protein KatS3mg112_0539 [Thermogutta sp.]
MNAPYLQTGMKHVHELDDPAWQSRPDEQLTPGVTQRATPLLPTAKDG